MRRISSNYHDWFLQGIRSYKNKKNLEIVLESDTVETRLKFLQVRKCLFNNFNLGNIILDVYIFEGEIPFEKIAFSKEFEEFLGVERDTKFFNVIVSEISSGSLLYIEINSSFGCEGKVICKEIEEGTERENRDVFK